jgi:hypothetical protein
MAALVLEQVMGAAEDHGVGLAVDMSRTEDEGKGGCVERPMPTHCNHYFNLWLLQPR